ncbi:cytochrome c heme-lyase [Acrasis kona]|uniref:Holocytochrome c-type synthase n=1 Tax=Acrasis kona TaxID=1008807 RepID=A0AAW2YZL1_9EUKA
MGNSQAVGERQEHSGCPVTGERKSTNQLNVQAIQEPAKSSGCPVMHEKQEAATESSGCPVMHNSSSVPTFRRKQKTVYNVYGEAIDPTNHMPANPNQQPHPSQNGVALSVERQKSNIPKAGSEGDDGTWLYPSPQMFYNALMRKGKGEGVRPEDMDTVIAIHNGVNEKSWDEVIKYEKALHEDCCDPRLLKFMGRPDAISPLARFKSTFMGYPKPFDRHDWILDRCGQKQQRYVIDYYYIDDADAPDVLEVDKQKGFAKPRHVYIDARPALDDLGSIYDRVMYWFKK